MIQRYLNLWFALSLDLFGGEISSNAASFFAAGLKGRYKEDTLRGPPRPRRDLPHGGAEGRRAGRGGRAAAQRDERGAARRLRRGLPARRRPLEQAAGGGRASPSGCACPRKRFYRHIGLYADMPFDPDGRLARPRGVGRAARASGCPPTTDRAYVATLQKPVREPGQIANWIAARPRHQGPAVRVRVRASGLADRPGRERRRGRKRCDRRSAEALGGATPMLRVPLPAGLSGGWPAPGRRRPRRPTGRAPRARAPPRSTRRGGAASGCRAAEWTTTWRHLPSRRGLLET